MTPTNEVAPKATGALPFSTSMRCTSLKLRAGMAGLKAPPHGTPSTTSRKASNSCSPQKDGTALDGPASPPGGASTPAVRASAVDRSCACRSPNSSADMIETSAGTSPTDSGSLVAVTCTVSIELSAAAMVAKSSQRIAVPVKTLLTFARRRSPPDRHLKAYRRRDNASRSQFQSLTDHRKRVAVIVSRCGERPPEREPIIHPLDSTKRGTRNGLHCCTVYVLDEQQ